MFSNKLKNTVTHPTMHDVGYFYPKYQFKLFLQRLMQILSAFLRALKKVFLYAHEALILRLKILT